MGIRIRSLLATGPLLVPLNSGGTVRLSPGGLSGELPEVEVADNPRVADLLDGRVIEVVDDNHETAPAADGEGAAEQTARPRKRTASAEQPSAR